MWVSACQLGDLEVVEAAAAPVLKLLLSDTEVPAIIAHNT